MPIFEDLFARPSVETGWVVTDSGNHFALATGWLRVDGGLGSPAWGNPGLRFPSSGLLARSGLGAYGVLARFTNWNGDGPAVALSATTNPADPGAIGVVFDYPDIKAFGLRTNRQNSRTPSADHLLIVAPREGGGFWVFGSTPAGSGSTHMAQWPNATLLWATDTQVDANLNALLSNYDGKWSSDFGRVLMRSEMPDGFLSRNGIAVMADDFNVSLGLTPVGFKVWSVTGTISTSGGVATANSGERAFVNLGEAPGMIDCYAGRVGNSRAVLYFRSDGTEANSFRFKLEQDKITLSLPNGTIVDQTAAIIPAAGTTYRMRVRDYGTHIECFVNDTSYLYTASTLNNTQTRIGIGSENSADSTFSEIAAYSKNIPMPARLGPPKPVPAGAGSVLSSYDFTGADGTALTSYSSAWAASAGVTWQLNTNRLRATAAGNGIAFFPSPSGAGDTVQISADILTPNTTPTYPDDWYPGVFVRYTDPNNYVHARFLYQTNSPEVEVWEKNAGAADLIGYWNIGGGNLAPNTTYNLRLAATGDQVAAFFNGECVVQAETTVLSGPYVGVGVDESANKSGQPAYDNVQVTAVPAPLPVVGSIVVTLLSSTSVRIAWVSEPQTDGQVEYGLTTAYGSSAGTDVEVLSEHSVTLEDLEPETVYHYRVRGATDSGITYSDDFTFETPEPEGGIGARFATAPEAFALRSKRWDNRALYAQSRVYADFIGITGDELDPVHATVYDLLRQFFVDTATWGLDRWESEMSLVPREGAEIQERREAIRARLRGLGTATVKLIKRIGESYLGGQLDVVEDYTAYKLIILFVDVAGVPINLQDIQDAVRAVVPAHLSIEFVFRYSTWDAVDAADLTWDEVDALGLTWDEWDKHFV